MLIIFIFGGEGELYFHFESVNGTYYEKSMLANSDKQAYAFCQIRNLIYLGCVTLKKKGRKKKCTPLPPTSVFAHSIFI